MHHFSEKPTYGFSSCKQYQMIRHLVLPRDMFLALFNTYIASMFITALVDLGEMEDTKIHDKDLDQALISWQFEENSRNCLVWQCCLSPYRLFSASNQREYCGMVPHLVLLMLWDHFTTWHKTDKRTAFLKQVLIWSSW